MRRILVASLLLLPSLVPAAALASQPADDSSTPTPALRVSTGVTGPLILDASDVHLTPDTLDQLTPNKTTVVLRMNLDEKGRAHDLQIIKSDDNLLDERVINAVRQFRFIPAKLDDQPVPVNLTLNVVVTQ